MSAALAELVQDDDAPAPKGAAVADHRAAIEDAGARAERERLARVYMRLAREEKETSDGLERDACVIDGIVSSAVVNLRIADATDDYDRGARAWEAAEAATVEKGGKKLTAFELRALAAEHQREAIRYHNSADAVVGCAQTLVQRTAIDGCQSRPVVVRCNRIGCPVCSRARAATAVKDWAPYLAELFDVRVLMLSTPNVRRGELLAGHDLQSRAFGIFRHMPWFLSRWDGGVVAHEVTLGRPPKKLRRRETKGVGDLKAEVEKSNAGGAIWWHPHLHVIVGNLERELPDGVRFDFEDLRFWWSEAVAQAQDPRRAKTQRTWKKIDALELRATDPDPRTTNGQRRVARRRATQLRMTAGPRPGVADTCMVWITEAYLRERDASKPGGYRDVFERDCKSAEEIQTVRAAATREAMKYISKGIPSMPVGAACELVRAKECRRWLQGFGTLHAAGVRHCRACRDKSCARGPRLHLPIRDAAGQRIATSIVGTPCAGSKWRLRDHGELCPCCKTVGETERALAKEPPACCEHGHVFDLVTFVRPPWEEWAALRPVGLLRPRRPRGPPATSVFDPKHAPF